MSEQALEERRKYFREWRRKNPERVQATQERYWLKKARERAERERKEQEQQES